MDKNVVKIGDAILYCGDANDILSDLEQVDSCVTDPPYGLSFMGKSWDYDVPSKEVWTKVHDALKSGGHLLSFFGSRTYHRGVIPIEDAGFEIRDQIMWLYGSGFPKSHNIGKAVDKLQGNKREVVGVVKRTGKNDDIYGTYKGNNTETKGTSEYEGWGTALKPAHEPIVMARKPFKGSVAKNVLKHGTGGINIDDSRVGTDYMKFNKASSLGNDMTMSGGKANENYKGEDKQGRFPANVMHDGSQVVQDMFGDKSQYYYCAKASKKDRDEGLENFEEKMMGMSGGAQSHGEGYSPSKTGEDIGLNRVIARKNTHPTVKPTELMQYLCRLVTPKGGVVLDPFMGSGSTGKAAMMSGFKFVGIELNREYFDIACARLEAIQKNLQRDLFTQ